MNNGSEGPVAMRASGLTRAFGDLAAVDGVDLVVASGQVHALVGLNGAGKSTLMRLLVGLLRPDAGSADVWGTAAWRAPAATRARIGYVGSGRSYPELTVTQHLYWSARLHGVPRREARRRAGDQIDRLALASWASTRARRLSSGNRQRLAVACALVHEPDLLVLDEPTTALDPLGVIELRRIILERAAQGVAVFVSSHHLDEMARLASLISVLHDGRIVGVLPPDGVDLERQFFRTIEAAALSAERAGAGA
jgi:ABC-2 type transport system ATP-binding protein